MLLVLLFGYQVLLFHLFDLNKISGYLIEKLIDAKLKYRNIHLILKKPFELTYQLQREVKEGHIHSPVDGSG